MSSWASLRSIEWYRFFWSLPESTQKEWTLPFPGVRKHHILLSKLGDQVESKLGIWLWYFIFQLFCSIIPMKYLEIWLCHLEGQYWLFFLIGSEMMTEYGGRLSILNVNWKRNGNGILSHLKLCTRLFFSCFWIADSSGIQMLWTTFMHFQKPNIIEKIQRNDSYLHVFIFKTDTNPTYDGRCTSKISWTGGCSGTLSRVGFRLNLTLRKTKWSPPLGFCNGFLVSHKRHHTWVTS